MHQIIQICSYQGMLSNYYNIPLKLNIKEGVVPCANTEKASRKRRTPIAVKLRYLNSRLNLLFHVHVF